jgi:hypothetical protein
VKSYLEATYFLCDLFEDQIDEGALKGSESTYISSILSFTKLVTLDYVDEEVETSRKIPKNKRLPFYRVQPFLADILAHLSATDEHVYDYCIELCRTNALAGVPLPYLLRIFSSQVLSQDVCRPSRRSRPVKKIWMEQLLFYHAALEVTRVYGLFLTRNDEGSNKHSACDALAEALTICGRPTTYSEIKYLAVHPDRTAFRSQAEAFFKISKRWSGSNSDGAVLIPDGSEKWERAAIDDVLDIWGDDFITELISPSDS